MEVQVGDVLCARMQATEKVILISEIENGFLFSTGFAVFRPEMGVVLPKFLLYYLRSRYFQARKDELASGATQKAINNSSLESMTVPVPPLMSQEKIATILGTADRLKKKREQANQMTNKILRAVFLKMFGDPATNPKEWPIESLGDVMVEGPQNGLYKHSSFYGSGVPIVRINNFYRGVLSTSELKRLRATQDEIQTYRLRKDDILLNRVNSPEFVGKCALIEDLLEDTVFESNVMRFRTNVNKVASKFVIAFLLTNYAKTQILSMAKRAVHQVSINQQDVKSIQLYLPTLDLQKKYVQVVENIRLLEARQAKSTEELDQLFNSLMSKAFRGKLVLDVPETEPQRTSAKPPTLTDYMKP